MSSRVKKVTLTYMVTITKPGNRNVEDTTKELALTLRANPILGGNPAGDDIQIRLAETTTRYA